jgi:hypothetical protein
LSRQREDSYFFLFRVDQDGNIIERRNKPIRSAPRFFFSRLCVDADGLRNGLRKKKKTHSDRKTERPTPKEREKQKKREFIHAEKNG